MTKATKTARKATKTAKKMMTPSAKKRKKGFTLIELLIVVGILAVVAAVAIPNLTRFMGEGKAEAWESDQSSLTTAVQAYRYANDNAWPTIDAGTIGEPDYDADTSGNTRQLDALTDANGIIDIDLLTADVQDSFLASPVDSACSFNYASTCAALTDPTIDGEYGRWCWHVNGGGTVEAFFFDDDPATAAPSGACNDYNDATNPAYP